MSTSEDVKFSNVRGLYLRKYGIHVVFNQNQEKNLQGYKVVDYSNNLNSVTSLPRFSALLPTRNGKIEI